MNKISTSAAHTRYDSNSVVNLVALAKNQNEVELSFTNGNVLVMRPVNADDSPFDCGYIEVAYGGYFKSDEQEGYNFIASEFFAMDNATLAACAFVFRANGQYAHHESGLGVSLEQLAGKLKKSEPISRAKTHLADALIAAEQKGVEGMGEARALGDIIQRLTTLQSISSVRKG